MSLSDHEQQVLEQMERALVSEDPKFASVFTSSRNQARTTKPGAVAKRTVLLSFAVILVGVAGLFAGVMTQLPPLGIVGFVLIVGAISVLVTSARVRTGGSTGKAKSANKAGKTRASFMQGLEDRWDRRQES